MCWVSGPGVHNDSGMSEVPGDFQLLRLYVQGDAAAFAELVRRHTDLVYSAVLRQTNGNSDLAEEVTQAVFVLLSARAAKLDSNVVVAAWLYRAARYCAK